MDLEHDDLTPSEEWQNSLNATLNRLSTQYLNLLRSASSIVALDSVAGGSDPSSSSSSAAVTSATITKSVDGGSSGAGGGAGAGSTVVAGTTTTTATAATTADAIRSGIVDPRCT